MIVTINPVVQIASAARGQQPARAEAQCSYRPDSVKFTLIVVSTSTVSPLREYGR